MISSTWSRPSRSWVISSVLRPWLTASRSAARRGAVVRVQVRGRLVQDQHGRVGQQRPGQGQPLPLAAGQAAPCAPTGVSQPCGSEVIQSAAAGPGQRAGQLGVAGRRRGRSAGWPGSWCRRCAASWASRRSRSGRRRRVSRARSQPLSVARPAGQVDEPEQHGGHRGLARPGWPEQGDPAAGGAGPGRARPAPAARPRR